MDRIAHQNTSHPAVTKHIDRLSIAVDQGRTDLANAERFIGKYHNRLMFVPEWRQWLAWDKKRWVKDNRVSARRLANRYAKSLWDEFAWIAPGLDSSEAKKVRSFLRATSQANGIANFLRLAEVDART